MSVWLAEHKIGDLRNEILFNSIDTKNDESGAYFQLAMQALAQAEQFMKLAFLKDN